MGDIIFYVIGVVTTGVAAVAFFIWSVSITVDIYKKIIAEYKMGEYHSRERERLGAELAKARAEIEALKTGTPYR